MNDKPVHIWKGVESELAYSCHAIKLIIKELTEKYAEGKITVKDYIEHGIIFTEPWEAKLNEESSWVVTRKKDEKIFWLDKETGEAFFTSNDAVNNAMKNFIAERINEFITTGTKIIQLAKFKGVINKYTGPCVCHELKESSRRIPFNWKKYTKGKFPELCFECSCGLKWWCFHPPGNQWEIVMDEKAWKMLMIYNGVAVHPVVLMEGAEIKGIQLLHTIIVDKGLIPIG